MERNNNAFSIEAGNGRLWESEKYKFDKNTGEIQGMMITK